MKDRLLRLARWVWMILVLAVAAWYLYRHASQVTERLREVAPLQWVVSALVLLAAKLLLVVLSQQSVREPDWLPAYADMFRINALTQVAKYLPGGIWHFVGRFAFYRNRGLANQQAGKAMLVENAWLVLSAAALGLAFSGAAVAQLLGETGARLIRLIPWAFEPWLPLVLWVAATAGLELWRTKARKGWLVSVAVVLTLQAAIWLLIGVSFWLLFSPADRTIGIPFAVGSFSLSWAIGYLTIFAPGGVGVREAMLVGLLGASLPAPAGVVLALVHRLIWVGDEVLLGILAAAWTGFAERAVTSAAEPMDSTSHEA